MNFISAKTIKRFENWTCLIYAEPGKGKTTMVRTLKGKTILLSVDGMYHVLEGLDNVAIATVDPANPNDSLREFLKWLKTNKNKYDNIVIDNLSTYQAYWLNEVSHKTTSGQPRLQDYGIINRLLYETIAYLKTLNKNVLLLAHESKEKVSNPNGTNYTQFSPDVRNIDQIMGIVPLVGRLVVYEKDGETLRQIVLQPTQATRAKDQLIGNMQVIDQMELLPYLQKEMEK